MTSSMIPIIKAVLIFTGIAAMSMFLKSSLTIVVDFSVSRFPILWSSFLVISTYPFLVINVIIITIVATSRYYRSVPDYGGEYNTYQIEPIISQTPPRRLEVKERPEVVYEEDEDEEEEEEDSGLINDGDEFVVLPSMMNEPEIYPQVEKPLIPASFGHRKLVNPSVKCNIMASRKKSLRVVRRKRHKTKTMENAWKMITEEGHYWRSDTFGGDAREEQPAMRKSKIFRDVTNHYYEPTVKMTKETSAEEMDRKYEEFIKKVKKERLESLRLDKEMV